MFSNIFRLHFASFTEEARKFPRKRNRIHVAGHVAGQFSDLLELPLAGHGPWPAFGLQWLSLVGFWSMLGG